MYIDEYGGRVMWLKEEVGLVNIGMSSMYRGIVFKIYIYIRGELFVDNIRYIVNIFF